MASDRPELEVSVTSNTDRLSERALHDCLVNLVRDEVLVGEVALKALVPKGESLDMTREAGHKGPYDEGLEVTAAVGIPEIHKANESSPASAKYPLFTDIGTGIFGDTGNPIFAKVKKFMYIPPDRGEPGFLFSSKGQEGKHFMAATFSVMVNMLQINGEKFKKDLTARLQSDKMV